MNDRAPEQIWLDGDVEVGDGYFPRCFEDRKPCSEPAISYTRTDVAQAQVAAAYEAATSARGMWFGFNSEGEPDGSYCTVEPNDPIGMSLWIKAERIRDLSHTDARAALDHLIAEAVKEALQVKPLVWEYPTEYGVLMRSRTSVGTYSIHDDEDSAFGRLLCYLHLTDDGDSTRYAIDLGGVGYVEPEEMADRCARDYEARILSALKGGEA